ncbi:STAS domain-containing protein [Actinoplanes sp. NPDC051470]|uniref:STAS domain-containing protein n=1 Tax=unclassified Actinoplanes TaxID=2626549 RepID=UPI00341B65F1
MTLSITRTAADQTVEVAPAGEIDVENAYLIKDAVVAAMAEGTPSRIELNMQDVTFIDSVGISALVSAHQMAGISGVKVVVTKPSRFAHRQLWVTGLLGLFGNPDPHGEGRNQPAVSGT